MSMKKARSLSEKWRFMTKKRRCSDCALVISDRSEHVSLILPPKRADFDLATVAEKLARV